MTLTVNSVREMKNTETSKSMKTTMMSNLKQTICMKNKAMMTKKMSHWA